MKVRHDIDRELRVYLEARTSAQRPDALLSAALAQVARTRQRPGWLLADRWASDSTQRRFRMAARQVVLVALLVAVALIAVALIAAVGSRPRLPKPFGPAGNGLIAFDANGMIVVANPDGSRRHPLTVGPGIASGPSWSPDGTRLAYFLQSGAREPAALFVADADGANRVDVSSALLGSVPLISQPAAWSPDGRQLSFTALTVGAVDGGPHLLIVGADGSGLRAIGDSSVTAQDPAWSPDGSRIAFKGHAGGVDAGYVLDVATDRVRRVTSTTIDPHSYGDPLAFRDPQWSPDGTRILFFVTVGSGNHDIFVVNADGSGERDLTNSLEDEAWPTWSPDGRLIAFDREYSVVVMKPDGTAQRALASDPLSPDVSRPRWSPDGSKIVVYTAAAADTVEILDVAGGTPIVMPAPGGASGVGSWQRIAGPQGAGAAPS